MRYGNYDPALAIAGITSVDIADRYVDPLKYGMEVWGAYADAERKSVIDTFALTEEAMREPRNAYIERIADMAVLICTTVQPETLPRLDFGRIAPLAPGIAAHGLACVLESEGIKRLKQAEELFGRNTGSKARWLGDTHRRGPADQMAHAAQQKPARYIYEFMSRRRAEILGWAGEDVALEQKASEPPTFRSVSRLFMNAHVTPQINAERSAYKEALRQHMLRRAGSKR